MRDVWAKLLRLTQLAKAFKVFFLLKQIVTSNLINFENALMVIELHLDDL